MKFFEERYKEFNKANPQNKFLHVNKNFWTALGKDHTESDFSLSLNAVIAILPEKSPVRAQLNEAIERKYDQDYPSAPSF